MNDLILKISLSVDQVNMVLSSLAKLPYETVANLITNITNQAQSQVSAHNEPKTGESTAELPPSAEANKK